MATDGAVLINVTIPGATDGPGLETLLMNRGSSAPDVVGPAGAEPGLCLFTAGPRLGT